MHWSQSLLAGFDMFCNWSNMSQKDKTAYCVWKITKEKSRKLFSDIWSLECMFLKMLTVIKDEKIKDLKIYMKTDNENCLYWCNLNAISQWIKQLCMKEKKSDNMMLAWVKSMLKNDSDTCCTVIELRNIIYFSSDSQSTFCEKCHTEYFLLNL